MTNQCQHGQLARVCLTCEQAAEIAQLREYLDAAQRRGEELRAQVAALTENGPPMQRGTDHCADAVGALEFHHE